MRFSRDRTVCYWIVAHITAGSYQALKTTTGVLISPYPDQEGNKLGSMSETRAISTASRRELSSRIFFFLQGKTLKKIHAILTGTLACFLLGRAKDLSAPIYYHLKYNYVSSNLTAQTFTAEDTCTCPHLI